MSSTQKLTRILLSPQMHPLGLCNNNDEEDLYEYGWVGVVKLEQPELDPSCLTVLGKVKNLNFFFSMSLLFLLHLNVISALNKSICFYLFRNLL